ncbi:MAG: cysteine desulfurase family protein, partial [Oscillospiraceae bacterium]
GTEGDNWALRAAARAMRRRGNHIITTAVEHAAVLETARFLEGEGFRVTYLSPDKTGHISVDDFRAALCGDTIAVSMMLVNNETGAVFPVAECVKAAKAHNKDILFHTDAVQGFCHVPFTPKSLGVDLLSVSGHKIGAPKGIGALYIKKEVQGKIKPLLFGGLQEDGRRPGTEPTAQIAAFAAACRGAKEQGAEAMERTRAVKEYALERLTRQVPGLVVVSPGDAPHICAVSLPGYPSQMVMNDLDGKGICVSNGSACHKGKPSHVFAALGLAPDVLKGMLRISFSPESTREEVDALADALTQVTRERLSAR